MELDKIFNEDCIEGMKKLPNKCIDLVITDPPYEIIGGGLKGETGGAFNQSNREYLRDIKEMADGISNDVLDELVRIMKEINIYIWCNKNQIRQYLNYFEEHDCMMDLLTWHKTNPTPMCNNKYLSDTEYVLFFRERGVPVYGSYDTKRKWYVTGTNKVYKEQYNHPTIKPLEIIENFIINSSKENDLVLDCYIGSGTTAIASMNLKRHYIGYEIDSNYYEVCQQRIKDNYSIFK